MKKPTLLLILLGLLFAWALTAQLSLSGLALYLIAKSDAEVAVPFRPYDYGTKVREVFPPYEASGLQTDDDILTLNGQPFNGEAQYVELWHTAKPGDTLRMKVNRRINGQWRETAVQFPLKPHVHDASEWPFTLILSTILPIGCLLVGFYIAFARPSDPLAWITMMMLASLGQFTGSGDMALLGTPWREMASVYESILTNTWPLWMVLFGLYFPEPFLSIKRRPWIAWLVALPSFAFAVLSIYGAFASVDNLRSIDWLANFQNSQRLNITVWFSVYVFTFFGLLTWKARQITAPDARRRLRVMLFGCSAALTPTLPVIFSELGVLPKMPFWLVVTSLSTLLLFPMTMAYVIVVQRAMDVRMVVRSGVQYAFASTGIKVLQIAIVVLVVWETIRVAQEANHRVMEILVIAIGIALVLSIRKLSDAAKHWMDKRFFREAYNSEVILTELSSSVAGIRDIKVLLETVTRRISESLHVPCIAVFLDRNGAFRPAYALGSLPSLDSVQFKPRTGVAGFMQRQQAPSKVFFGDPQNWVHGTSPTEQEMLEKLSTQILLPLCLKSRLLGIISLGAKRSEEPYSRGDLQLLSAVASQTGLALENAELAESVRREIAQRERLDRELEIAREVQQRLFPQKLPVVSGLDFAGYCRPAEGVGGDYYDFIRAFGGALGIAIGDVSGKGIAAALMMASLQASLRGQTIKRCESLAETIQLINRLVYEASAENRYATFFYAEYDPAARTVRYVNAGHNPPLVCRAVDGKHEFLRLEEGGTVVGLFPEYPFKEGTVQLQPGDVVVAFTDGISEAMNEADEEFSEERLMEAIHSTTPRSASDMITHILAQVDGFTAGAKQHDDMTLVVIRVQ